MSLLHKLLYIWLIFCLGGIGPLIYFDGFTPGHEHGEHPYHWVIIEEAPHVHNPLPSRPETLAEQHHFWLVSQLASQVELLMTAQAFVPGFSRFFTSGLSNGYILSTAHFNVVKLPSRFGLISPIALSGHSAWLAPPDKPPAFSL